MNIKSYVAIIFLIVSIAAFAAESPIPETQLGVSEEPLAKQGGVVLTQAEIDAAFSKIPPEKRLPFIRDGEKVELLVRNLLRNKILANEAKKAGYDQQPLVKHRTSLAAEGELATQWIENIVADAPPADYATIAYEAYLANPGVWKSEDTVDVSHILISSESRSEEAARALAAEVLEELKVDPERFDEMVIEYSDDPSKRANDGRFPMVRKGEMVEPFEKAVFAMGDSGEISGLVQTTYGFHIIRLNQRHAGTIAEFDDIKAIAMEQVRTNYLESYRTRYLRQVLSDPLVLPDGADIDMAKRYFGENLELAPVYNE
jgi:peptidyl-prolyl cis-trans isomerase C